MTQIKEIIESASQKCHSTGARLTVKRQTVLKILLESKASLSAYNIAELYKNKTKTSIPVMSVYRILEFMEEKGLVHKLKLTNKYIACKHINCSHNHDSQQFLICSKCQAVKEVAIKKSIMNDLINDLKGYGYQMIGDNIELECICNECLISPET